MARRDPQHCPLSERNEVPKQKLTKYLAFSTFGTNRPITRPRGAAGAFPTPLLRTHRHVILNAVNLDTITILMHATTSPDKPV